MSRLSSQLQQVFALDPAAPALEFEAHWHSWGVLWDAAAALNHVLDDLGFGEGTRIGVLIRNRVEFVETLLALTLSSRCLATINATAPDDKLAADLHSIAAPVLIGLASDWARPGLKEAAAAAGSHAVILGDGAPRLIAQPGRARFAGRRDAPGTAIEMLTSGTTGTPKRIPLAAAKLEKSMAGMASYEKSRAIDSGPRLRGGVQIVTAPMAHIAGVTHILNNMLAGRKVCLLEKFTVDRFRDALVRHRPKVAGAPPSALRMLLEANLPKEDVASLKAYRSGTAPLDPALADAFYERYGIPVLQNYGATEFAGGIAGWTLDDFHSHWTQKRGSVGRLNNGVAARAVDPETGEPRPDGEDGLLELRGPNIGNGCEWLRTNDLGVIDTDGFLWIKGRHDNAIIRGGFKIIPDDIVRAVEAHPSIREAAVAALPDDRLGQVPVAAYIRKAGSPALDSEELRGFLRERLMPYQVPVRLLEVEEMPRTPSMKVSQPALLTLFAAA